MSGFLKKKKSYKLLWCRGQAMLVATVFFMAVSLTIVLGLAGPVLSQLKVSSEILKSRESFVLAEAEVDDVVYRLNNGMNVGSSESLSLGGNLALISITDIPSGKTILSESDWLNSVRRIEVELGIGEGHAFNYGIQTGKGGFEIRNAEVIGSVFSTGNIVGTHSGATITGSAFAANKPADLPDQKNDSPLPIDSNKFIAFGDEDIRQDAAQSFVPSQSGILSKVEIHISKVENPSNLTVRIVENDEVLNVPSVNEVASTVISASWVTTQNGWIETYFPSDTFLESGETYWIVLDGSTHPDRYYKWAANDSSYSLGQPKVGRYGGDWSDTSNSHDAYFRVFFEGEKSFINNLKIGEGGEGDAHAYEVNNSIVENEIFCQIGSNNNMPCDDSQNDPNPNAFPISEGNIAQWKADAEAGGVIEGNYFVSDGEELGPIKIDGDLTLDSGGDLLILTGSIWVTGNITVPNGGRIELASSFGSNSGIMISDGYIKLDNNVEFMGSGQEGSYLMLLTTSDCPESAYCDGNYAIQVLNNVGAVILNAQNGTIHFNNNSGAREATAYKTIMENNAVVEYESGLASVNFTSGPTGGFVVEKWSEVE